MPKAIPYIRFSAAHQGDGSTVARQQDRIADWLSKNDDYFLLKETFHDLAVSGFSGKHLEDNQGFGRILQAIESGDIGSGDCILVEAIDRIGRLEPMEMFTHINKIVSNGVDIITLEDNQTFSHKTLNSGHGQLFTLVGKIQQAHEYSSRLSNRIRSAYLKKVERARNGQTDNIRRHTPFWLTTSGKLIPENTEVLRECIALYIKGYGHRKIILTLVEKHPILSNTHPSTLKRWFKNRALIGEWETSDGEVIPNVCEKAVDLETFYELQRLAKARARRPSPSESYELSGLCYCSNCGAPYHFRRKRHLKEIIIYANCSQYLKRGAHYCDNKPSWPYEVLKFIHDNTYSLHLALAAMDLQQSKDAKRLQLLIDEKGAIDDRLKKLIGVLEVAPDQEVLIVRLKELDGQQKQLSKEINYLEKVLSGEELNALDLASEPDYRGKLLRDEGGFQVYENNDPYLNSVNSDIDAIESDPIHLRSSLKRRGYAIELNQKTASIRDAYPRGEFTLIKRSTRHNCYLVRWYTPPFEILSAEDEETKYPIEEDERFFAMRRNCGVIAAASSYEELLETLESITEASVISKG
ncbi:recombinase family protein [Zhongshania aliphaticivorans]|uniref:Resolvase/invertase-type recombinase catalytic domain-containing protein n=1 Tax=Zhongshania aliphaticivorans TaxID=1470434 RepID=A0A127M129_9GAMM|nr:recombinase family protein [Zhongshania aliphaticivorans]AMO66919.1 hypothetical protein AZF00_00765 [Zhongshania aliphaticivorans]